ncbi:MAG TPA: hypothetical protein VN971_05265 [Thermoanaerobaculia bacterium]|nr:hypothetical protein [Thermoanaerobaculia bacterium]
MDEKTPYSAPPPPPPGAPFPPPPAAPPAGAMAPAVMVPYASGHKSPVLAGFLSMFPGLGHLYLGLYQRGIAFGIAWVIAISFSSHGRGGAFFGPMIAFIWFFAIIDAVRQAHAINRGYVAESGFGPSPAQIRRASSGTAGLTWGVILVGIGALWLIDRYVDIDWSFFDRWGAPAAFILLGIILIATHVRRKRRENESGVGMPPRTG